MKVLDPIICGITMASYLTLQTMPNFRTVQSRSNQNRIVLGMRRELGDHPKHRGRSTCTAEGSLAIPTVEDVRHVEVYRFNEATVIVVCIEVLPCHHHHHGPSPCQSPPATSLVHINKAMKCASCTSALDKRSSTRRWYMSSPFTVSLYCLTSPFTPPCLLCFLSVSLHRPNDDCLALPSSITTAVTPS